MTAAPRPPRNATHDIRSRTSTKESLPESFRQAQIWDNVENQVPDIGLCEKCAAQYARGMQIGFTQSKPPCADCKPIVEQHGGRTRPNDWSTLHRIRGNRWRPVDGPQ